MDAERIWAVNVAEKDFEREFMQRFPRADFVPTRDYYLGCTTSETRLIDAPSSESFIIDDIPTFKKKVEKEAEEVRRINCTCPGCKKEFQHKGALALHKRRCKSMLNLKVLDGEANIPSTD